MRNNERVWCWHRSRYHAGFAKSYVIIVKMRNDRDVLVKFVDDGGRSWFDVSDLERVKD
jgi:hypothetical protein